MFSQDLWTVLLSCTAAEEGTGKPEAPVPVGSLRHNSASIQVPAVKFFVLLGPYVGVATRSHASIPDSAHACLKYAQEATILHLYKTLQKEPL